MQALNDILQKMNAINALCHRVVFFDTQTRDYRPGQRRRAVRLLDEEIIPQLRENLEELYAMVRRIPNGESLISSRSLRLEHVPETSQSFQFNNLVNRIREILEMPALTLEDLRVPPHPNELYEEALQRITRYRLTD